MTTHSEVTTALSQALLSHQSSSIPQSQVQSQEQVQVTKQVDVLILGSGPTGLGAATRLSTLQTHRCSNLDWSFFIVDQSPIPGGLACTDETPQGFLFDVGGHVIFSHYDYFDELLQESLGKFQDEKAWVTHQRESFVRYKGVWVPYPFQNNIKDLPVEDQVEAIQGLVEARIVSERLSTMTNALPPGNFDEWIVRTMGEGIANQFMRPYNFKVWATPPTLMHWNWLGERVSVVDVKRAVANALRRVSDVGWGPNATFTFPTRGGTGAIWKAVADKFVNKSAMKLGHRVVSVDLDAKRIVVRTPSGQDEIFGFTRLINTLPLDVFLNLLKKSLGEEAEKARKLLAYSSTHVIGLGMRGANPHGSKCWLYFPENNCPFYRATVFSNYAPDGNVPGPDVLLPTLRLASLENGGEQKVENVGKPGPYWSLMLEVSESAKHKPVDLASVVEDTIRGCIATGLLSPNDEIVSVHHRRVEYGYPTPSLDRDRALAVLLPLLRAKSVWSRGRFGSWKYEVANQDHSLALGVECVDNIAFGCEEVTLTRPSFVNRAVGSVKNKTPLFQRLPEDAQRSNHCPIIVEPSGPNSFIVHDTEFTTSLDALKGKSFTNQREFVQFLELTKAVGVSSILS